MNTSISTPSPRNWLGPISVLFCSVLVISNVLAIKPLCLPGLRFILIDGGNLLFPVSYILGDLLVEVYGYAQARRVIWMGFAVNLLAAAAFYTVAALPPAPGWDLQNAFSSILSQTPRVVLGSVCAFWCGSFLNAWIMARLKVLTRGRFLWFRTITSTIGGEGIDSLLFTAIAFSGVWPRDLILRVIFWNFLLKVSYEILVTPLTCRLASRLKKVEGSDPFDTHTAFTPFSLRG